MDEDKLFKSKLIKEMKIYYAEVERLFTFNQIKKASANIEKVIKCSDITNYLILKNKKKEEIFKEIDKLKISNNIDVPSRLFYNNALEKIKKLIENG